MKQSCGLDFENHDWRKMHAKVLICAACRAVNYPDDHLTIAIHALIEMIDFDAIKALPAHDQKTI